MVANFVEKGKVFSETWSSLHGGQRRRQNLFRDLSLIMLLWEKCHMRAWIVYNRSLGIYIPFQSSFNTPMSV